MRAKTSEIIRAIAKDILRLAQLVMDENGLHDSLLRKDTSVLIANENNPVIQLIFDEYIEYIEHIEKGRKAGTGELPPIDQLRDWALRHHLPANNKTLWAIAQSIRRNGTRARPILSRLEDEINQSFHLKWGDMIFNIIVSELELDFFK